ncbi:30S ribosomal protein S11 [bacterium]|nr:30S ribosomal protein S11 [bacterium]
MARQSKSPKKKKMRSVVEEGLATVKSTFNNTLITISDKEGRIYTWSSGGRIGFKGTRKSTPYAAQLAAREVANEMLDQGMKRVEVRMKGPGPGREAAVRALQAEGLMITRIKDIRPVPHGGCRPKKRRRV